MSINETEKNDSSREKEKSQPVEDKSQPIEGNVENKIQPIDKPVEPAKPERDPLVTSYDKDGKTYLVFTDETYPAFEGFRTMGANIKSESEYNREQQWEAEATHRREQVFLEKMREIQARKAKLEVMQAEQDFLNSIIGRTPRVQRIIYAAPSDPEELEESDDDWEDDDENGDDEFDEDEFDDLDDK